MSSVVLLGIGIISHSTGLGLGRIRFLFAPAAHRALCKMEKTAVTKRFYAMFIVLLHHISTLVLKTCLKLSSRRGLTWKTSE